VGQPVAVSGRKVQRVYRIDNVLVEESVMKRFPLKSAHGYTVAAKHEGNALLVTIIYDSERFVIGVSSGNTIGNQAGITIHICPVQKTLSENNVKKKQKAIVLDCGHGGKDTGAIAASGISEKDVALAIGLRLKKILQKHNITVIMTRSTDTDLGLDERTIVANAKNVDLFVSLHANYALNKHASGIETWYVPHSIHIMRDCSDHAAIPYVKTVIAHRSAGGSIPAHYIHQNLMAGTRRYTAQVVDRHIKAAISQVLLGCRMPALLIELGFLSNVEEAKRLSDGIYQDIQAQSISMGIVDYFMYLDKMDK